MKTPAALVTFALTLVAPQVDAAACGDLVESDVRLTADLVNCPGPALEVLGQSDLVIDLNGFRVASAAGVEATIRIHDSRNIRLIGGTIGGEQTGVAVNRSNQVYLEDLDVEGTDLGVYLWSVHDSEISFSRFTNNRMPIVIHDEGLANRNAVISNHFNDNSGGVLINGSHRNRVEGNSFRRNTGAVSIASSSGNLVERNGMFDGNQAVSISGREPSGDGSNSNQIRGNKMYDNLYGVIIRAPKSDRNLSKYNEITKNAFRGGSSGLEILGPRAYRTEVSENGFYDIAGPAITDQGTRTIIQFNNCSGGC